MDNQTATPNRLINEKSPYLLQHAHNPVDWYPWGDEAFKKAKEEDKPVFLSIGYSTCHWCHVMERESFVDDEVAELLNRDFVAIKVDREERPDIDSVYMSACQALTGTGGWPLTIVMTPDQKPFFAATYLPKYIRYNTVGLMDLLPEITHQWEINRKKLLEAGNQINAFLNSQGALSAAQAEPSHALINDAVRQFGKSFDLRYGGFGYAPKFPTPHNLLFLLRYSVLEKDSNALSMAEKTLLQMYRGGLFDHIGGGFSRYSTDTKWLVPHFEKMLYDNALLIYVYLEAYQITKRPLYREIAERTIDYVFRELTDKKGGFYCGQDADSDGIEGDYYVFTPDEIISVLGKADAEAFCRRFGITESGNFEGKSIPNLLDTADFDKPDPKIKQLCQTLYDYRLKRTRLHKDDKILTSWNALMLAALAKAYLVLGDARYIQAACKAQDFIDQYLVDDKGFLRVRWRDGEAAVMGHLDDYALYAWSLLELYYCTFEARFLHEADRIAGIMTAQFWDKTKSGFYLYAHNGEQLISRPKEVYDGAIPSGNSVAGLVLSRLAKLTAEQRWQELSDQQSRYLAANIQNAPMGYSFSLLTMLESLYPSKELICVTKEADAPDELQNLLNDSNVQNLTVLIKSPQNEMLLSKVAPFTVNYPIPKSGEAYYLCQNGSCASPVYEISALREMLPYGQ